MNRLKVAGCALNQTPLDWSGNKRRILKAIEEARLQNASLLCLPELCISGYGCEDAFFNPHVHQKALEILFSLLPATKGIAVSVGLPLEHRGVIFNSTALIANGKLIGFVPKKSLAGDGVHYEPRWFKAWEPEQVSSIHLQGTHYPFGDLHFDFEGVKVGFEICEEAWVAHRPGSTLARRGADVILNPSASHFAFGKLRIRERFVTEGSRAFNVAYVYSNLLGNESGRIIFDGGVLIADGGELVAQGPRFSYQEVLVTSSVVDISRNRVVRARTASYQPDFEEKNHLCVETGFRLPEATLETQSQKNATWETSPHWKEEEFTRAVSLGLFDFMRKSRQQGFVISLSGGVDSAAVTLLCRTALEFAFQELGMEGLLSRLSSNSKTKSAKDVETLAHLLITTAYQATKNSSEATRNAARAIAKDAGAEFYDWSVDTVLENYQSLIETALSKKLTWESDDIALQNIQARTRGPSIWMIANLKNALLLATSNRSEAAVGYATMDGDTCGGLSPIGGIDKNFLRAWAHWMAAHGPVGLRAFRSFETVFAQPPTAELRPQSQHQTDEDDLMPYDVLDQIERLAIRDKKSPVETFEVLKVTMKGTDSATLKKWIRKFFTLWCRNQWKRERYAPSFHLDDESLDPKTWCRFPILSSGFEEELDELERIGG